VEVQLRHRRLRPRPFVFDGHVSSFFCFFDYYLNRLCCLALSLLLGVWIYFVPLGGSIHSFIPSPWSSSLVARFCCFLARRFDLRRAKHVLLDLPRRLESHHVTPSRLISSQPQIATEKSLQATIGGRRKTLSKRQLVAARCSIVVWSNPSIPRRC